MDTTYQRALERVFDVTSAQFSDAYGETARAQGYIEKQSPAVQKLLHEASLLCTEHYNLTWSKPDPDQHGTTEVWIAYGDKCREAARLIATENRAPSRIDQILGALR